MSIEDHALFEIATHAARAQWVTGWADESEERGESLSGELMDCAPETPGEYLAEAFMFLGSLPESPWITLAAFERCNDGKRPTDENFGHCAAMQSMGHGVSLGDDWNVPNLVRGDSAPKWTPGHFLEGSMLCAADHMPHD